MAQYAHLILHCMIMLVLSLLKMNMIRVTLP